MLRTIHHPQCDPPERRAHYHATRDREQERRGNSRKGEPARRYGSDGKPVDQKCAGVIQQALALENRQDPMRGAQLAEYGRCGDGVWRSDDGTERNRRSPGHRRYERVGDEGDGCRCESDGKDDQTGDRGPVVPEIPERCVVRRVEQDGGDEERQRKLRGQGERRPDWDQRKQRTAECEEDRVGCSDTSRRGREDNGGHEEAQ